MKLNKKSFFLFFVTVVFIAILNYQSPKNKFKRTAQLYANSIINGNYDLAMEVQYCLPGNEFLREQQINSLKNNGTSVVDFKIYKINKLSNVLYQADGIFISKYGDEEYFIPFYFKMDNKWYMALNEFQIPSYYLQDIEYKTFDNAISPDGLEILN